MFLAKNNQVRNEKGEIVEEGLCASLFIGADFLKEAYKTLICQDFSKEGVIYVLNQERDNYILGNLLYSDLCNWLEGNLSDIVEANNLFGVSFIVKVDNEEQVISVRDLLIDKAMNTKNSPCCLTDFLTSRLESTVESLM